MRKISHVGFKTISKCLSGLLMLGLVVPDLLADSAPSMHLNAYTSKDAVLKMQKIKVVQSASASFFEIMNYTAGYCGFQQPNATLSGSTIIASLWDPNTVEGIYSKVEYVHPTINSSRFGGEGDGYKTLGPYNWELNQWYNMVVRSWKSNNKLYIATFVNNLSDSKWFHTSTLSMPFPSKYLGNNNDAFMENWLSNGQYSRKAFFKDFFYLDVKGNWGKPTSVAFSANDGTADVSRNGIYHNSFNAYYDSAEDAFCMEHGGTVIRSGSFGTGRSLNLGTQLGQANSPQLNTGQITSVNAAYENGTLIVNWMIDEQKSPQLSTFIQILDASNVVVKEIRDTVPQVRSNSTRLDLTPGNYNVKISMTDIFNQVSETLYSGFVVTDARYLTLSESSIMVSAKANSIKTFDINSNTNWTLATEVDWIKTDKTNGTGDAIVKISTTDNPDTTKTRTAIIQVSGVGVETKQITVLQNKNEVWYYILNQRGWISGAAVTTTAMTGMPLGTELTALAPEQNNYYQHWKLEYKPGTKYLQLINRMTGLSVDAGCKANLPSDNYFWFLQKYSGSKAYPGYRIISQNGQIGMHASNGRVFPYNHELPECFWVFMKPGELFGMPEQLVDFSVDDQNKWYYIHTKGRDDRNYLTDNGLSAVVTGTNLQQGNDAQMWKFIDKEDGTVEIISKKTNGHIQVPTANSVQIPLVRDSQKWSLKYIGNEQYRIVNGKWELNLNLLRKLISFPGSTVGDPSSWTLTKASVVNSLHEQSLINKYKVFASNSKIIVNGTNASPTIYNATGLKMCDKTDLLPGIYIVKIENEIHKVIIY
jgi:hypothetical protein